MKSEAPRCPQCHARATIEDISGGTVYWRCWNGHSFTVTARALMCRAMQAARRITA